MKKWASLFKGNADILLFQIANFVYSPLLYLLLASGYLHNGTELLKIVYIIEVYLAVPAVIFYFNQKKISALLEVSGRLLYDSIALAKFALGLLTALVLVYVLKVSEPSLLPIFLASFFGNAVTPHWLLSKHGYTTFTLVSFALRLVVLVGVLLGHGDYFLIAYVASLLVPGLFAYFYFRPHIPAGSKKAILPALTSLIAPGIISLTRNFTTSILLTLVLGVVPSHALAQYTILERIVRSGFSFVVPYILRANLKSEIRPRISLLPLLAMAIMACYLYTEQPESYILLLLLAVLILSLDLIAFIHSERAGSALISKTAYGILFALAGLALAGVQQFYMLVTLLVLLPLLVQQKGQT